MTKQCFLLLAKLGVEQYHKKYPQPSLEELLTGGVRFSVARRDKRAMNRFQNKLEIIDATFKAKEGKG